MWSASSSTLISMASRRQCPWPMRSSRRPGQAMRTSTPLRSAWTWGFWPTPPKTVRLVRPAASASGTRDSWTCWASSRVGTRTSARGRVEAAERPPARRATSGSRKAKVLPEPVRPRPRTSRPASESGSVAAWIGVGVVMPRFARTAARSAGRPRSAKEGRVDEGVEEGLDKGSLTAGCPTRSSAATGAVRTCLPGGRGAARWPTLEPGARPERAAPQRTGSSPVGLTVGARSGTTHVSPSLSFLPASLTFSPASLTAAEAWSPLPSAFISSSLAASP